MWLSIICAIVCFAVAVIMFTPQFRSFPCYQSLSFYFLFEGAWNLINGIIVSIWPNTNFMIWIHYVGVTVFAGYFLYCMYYHYWYRNTKKK